jgi:NADPH:quinone reductase-like Zn-dependent oxidoreductase
MRAIVIKKPGGPEVLAIEERPDPAPRAGHVLIDVRAFGVNHAETHMREGRWPQACEISGIECAGVVRADPDGCLARGTKVVAFMGGMGRVIAGSYAERTSVPSGNVIAVETGLSWEALAAIPESYATAWACLHGNLALQAGHTILIRGGTSALGQAAINIAAHAGARVIASTRDPRRAETLTRLGATEVVLETGTIAASVREKHSSGLDAVLDLVGNTTVVDSLALLRRDGRLCQAGFLGGMAPMTDFLPVAQLPSRVHFSFFGSFVFGTPSFPVSEIPMQTIVERVEAGIYRANPSRVFGFEEIRDAHRVMDAGAANGKIVVRL